MYSRNSTIAGVLMIAFFLGGCGSSTRITASWVDPDARNQPQDNKTVFLASLSRNMEVRTKLEAELARQAEARGIKAVKSTEYFSPDFYQQTPSQSELASRIRQTGADAILTVTLIRQESETRYQRGSAMYSPFPAYQWYGGFYSYYSYWRPYFYDPGYYVEEKTYFLETNLYDVKTEKLIWSAQSETLNPSSIDQFAKEYPKKLIAQMKKDGLLKE